jgi:hypothetical protein
VGSPPPPLACSRSAPETHKSDQRDPTPASQALDDDREGHEPDDGEGSKRNDV